MRKIIPYNQDLVAYAKQLRKNMTLGEIALWREINTLNWVSDEIKLEIDKLKPLDFARGDKILRLNSFKKFVMSGRAQSRPIKTLEEANYIMIKTLR